MHSLKYGLVKVCSKTSNNQLIKVANSPIGFSKIAIKMHQQELYKRLYDQNINLNQFEKAILVLPTYLPDYEYNIHIENINNNRQLYKELDFFEIYKMERMYSEVDNKTKEIVVMSNQKDDDINSPKIAFSAAIGSFVGICSIVGVYKLFDFF